MTIAVDLGRKATNKQTNSVCSNLNKMRPKLLGLRMGHKSKKKSKNHSSIFFSLPIFLYINLAPFHFLKKQYQILHNNCLWYHARIQKVLSEGVQLCKRFFFSFFSWMRGGRIKLPLLAAIIWLHVNFSRDPTYEFLVPLTGQKKVLLTLTFYYKYL